MLIENFFCLSFICFKRIKIMHIPGKANQFLQKRKKKKIKTKLNRLYRKTYPRQVCCNQLIVSSPLKLWGEGSCFWNLDKEGGHEKTSQKQRVSWKGGRVLLERRGFPNCFISFPSEKHVFITIGFFCLVDIHACCNQ